MVSQQQSNRTNPPSPRSQQIDSTPSKSSIVETDNEIVENVEVAKEAFAYQTFNQQTGNSVSNRHTPSPIDMAKQEIQMEDLSKRKKKHSSKKLPNVHLHNVASNSHSRSHSHSPKREEGLNSNRSRSTSMVEGSKRDRSSTPKSRGHSKSEPISEINHLRPSSASSEEECHKIHSRSKESQSPKTLRPAEAPALTLFSQDSQSMAPNLDSLKLVPPAEHLVNPSDTSSNSTEQNMNTEGQEDKTTDLKKMDSKPNFVFKSTSGADVEISKAKVDMKSMAQVKSVSATDQLTKLAQIVQEHFSDDRTNETELSVKISDT